MAIAQSITMRHIRNTAEEIFGNRCRVIKIHGGRYQERGLPDLLVLTPGWTIPNIWLEIKNSWDDKPTSLQSFHIKNLREYGFVTCYVVGDEVKKDFGATKPTQLREFFQLVKEMG